MKLGPLVALLGLVGAGLTGVSVQSNRYYQSQPAKTENLTSPRPETIPSARSEPDNDKSKKKSDAEDGFKATDWLLVLFNGLLALYTWRLYKATRGLVDAAGERSKDMKASIKVAQKSAEAAQKAADVSEAALIDAERPFLISTEPKLKIFPYGPPGSIPVEPPQWVGIVDYGFINVGRSVAFLKEVTAELLFIDELPEQPVFSIGGICGFRTVLGHYPIGVDKTYECPTYGTRDKIDGSTFTLIGSSKSKAFLFGYARYTDIFGYLHTEGFCFRFTKIGDGANIKSECTVVGSNSYNFVRRKKLPPVGYESPANRPKEATESDLARINQIVRGQD